MLILSRRVGESIVIGDDIFFTIIGFKGNQVSIGFDMPKSIAINRYEIYQKIQSEKEGTLLVTNTKYCPSTHFHPFQSNNNH